MGDRCGLMPNLEYLSSSRMLPVGDSNAEARSCIAGYTI